MCGGAFGPYRSSNDLARSLKGGMLMNEGANEGASVLAALSDNLAGAVDQAGRSVVRVDGRRRLSASGVVWPGEGLILTADHVLEREEDLTIGLPDGRTLAATIVGRDSGTDLALLRAEARELAAIQQGPQPSIGHLALLVARPGDGLATSIGVVSALGGPTRTWRGGQLEGFIRTDATFYPGFSGGPLVDTGGKMIGLATSHFGRAVGLAISLATVSRVTSALLSHGRVRRGFPGLSSQPVPLPETLRSSLGLGQESGLLVVGVEPAGPAEAAGLMIGDLLIALGGQAIRNTDDLRAALGPELVGQSAPVRVIRGGESRELSVTIGERG
jgi:S1-C subfamily serine protease